MLQVLHELWDFVNLFYYKVYKGNILCAQLLLHPLMDFVNTHTQWPTCHEDDLEDWILRCCKFYMSYGTLSWGASVSYRHISSLTKLFLRALKCVYSILYCYTSVHTMYIHNWNILIFGILIGDSADPHTIWPLNIIDWTLV